jgi:hypothetical protein
MNNNIEPFHAKKWGIRQSDEWYRKVLTEHLNASSLHLAKNAS